ncbi:hypothetical protein I3843_Q012300 [Carya illinoinensis]|nr:hypothetical protein I3843_Q012300 [Carya illinoinensis]
MTKITEIKHSSHRHQLKLMCSPTPYTCDGCKELGFEACYQRNKKLSIFHICSTKHPFFKKGNFIFRDKSPSHAKFCVACGKQVRGFRYRSTRKKAHVLHPCCLKLPANITDRGVNLNLAEKTPSKCLICHNKKVSKEIEGWTYVSTCGKYCYHVACVKDLCLENWKKGYFRQQNTSNLVVQHTVLTRSQLGKKGSSMIKLVLELIVSSILDAPQGSLNYWYFCIFIFPHARGQTSFKIINALSRCTSTF